MKGHDMNKQQCKAFTVHDGYITFIRECFKAVQERRQVGLSGVDRSRHSSRRACSQIHPACAVKFRYQRN